MEGSCSECTCTLLSRPLGVVFCTPQRRGGGRAPRIWCSEGTCTPRIRGTSSPCRCCPSSRPQHTCLSGAFLSHEQHLYSSAAQRSWRSFPTAHVGQWSCSKSAFRRQALSSSPSKLTGGSFLQQRVHWIFVPTLFSAFTAWKTEGCGKGALSP